MTYQFREFYIPDRMMGGLQRYLDSGIEPGDFLQCVLKNDLYGACNHGDKENVRNLPAYIGYLYNEVNGSAWGSRENYTAWRAKFRPETTD